MKKRMAAILLILFILQSAAAAYAANPEDVVITPASINDTEIEIVADSLTAGSMISFQAFYTAPGANDAALDYINQYTLDNEGAVTIDYPTRSAFAAGGMLTVVIGEAGLTTERDRTRTYTFSAYEIKSIQIRTLD